MKGPKKVAAFQEDSYPKAKKRDEDDCSSIDDDCSMDEDEVFTVKSGEDSPHTPQSGKFTQDEEFTDPDDPVTVVKTSIHIDQLTIEEEKDRILK